MIIYIYIYIYITYDYRMTIIIREYEIYILNIKYTLIVCLEPGRGIDVHAYSGKTSLQHTSSDMEAPFGSMR